MKNIGIEDARNWLALHGYNSDGAPDWSGTFALPGDSGLKVGLANSLSLRLADDECLFAATEIGVWESSGDRFIFQRFLNSGGANLEIAPEDGSDPVEDCFLLFESTEARYLKGAIALSLLFIYGGYCARSDGSLIVQWSHDEYIWADSRSARSQELKELFESFDLQPLASNPSAEPDNAG